jgi:hypothetical protein
MGRRTKPPRLDTPDLTALADRAVKLDNDEILSTLDTTLSALTRYLPEFRRTRDSAYLGEMSMAAQAIYVMVEEMATRAGARAPTQPTRQLRTARSYE